MGLDDLQRSLPTRMIPSFTMLFFQGAGYVSKAGRPGRWEQPQGSPFLRSLLGLYRLWRRSRDIPKLHSELPSQSSTPQLRSLQSKRNPWSKGRSPSFLLSPLPAQIPSFPPFPHSRASSSPPVVPPFLLSLSLPHLSIYPPLHLPVYNGNDHFTTHAGVAPMASKQ